ncbi:hypothetical protein PoB_003458500 [Plakobranchus ocellatus]|uniref:Uncharacterized protein n=1 Tax=Plakobranchus ocellatus TaxID=259542 RepID=A0AAV4AIT4_9GAST|nr:hypothetical protein PoB_003458500 [Plakobranchus ocellatus]
MSKRRGKLLVRARTPVDVCFGVGAPLQASEGLHLLFIPASSLPSMQTNLAHQLLSRYCVNRCEAHRRLLSHPLVPQQYLKLMTYLEHVRYGGLIPKHTIRVKKQQGFISLQNAKELFEKNKDKWSSFDATINFYECMSCATKLNLTSCCATKRTSLCAPKVQSSSLCLGSQHTAAKPATYITFTAPYRTEDNVATRTLHNEHSHNDQVTPSSRSSSTVINSPGSRTSTDSGHIELSSPDTSDIMLDDPLHMAHTRQVVLSSTYIGKLQQLTHSITTDTINTEHPYEISNTSNTNTDTMDQ